MDKTVTTDRGDERLSEADLLELRLRIGRGALSGGGDEALGIRIADVAETVGVPPSEIEETLRAIRSERAIASSGEDRKPFPVVHAAGFAALALALGVAWVRLSPLPHPVAPSPVPLPFGGLQLHASRVTSRSPDTARQIGTNLIQKGPGTPPPGFRVYIANGNVALEGDGMRPKVNPVSYEEDRDGLVRSAEELIDLVLHPTQPNPFPNSQTGPIRDLSGNTFTVRPNEIHFTFDGWSGMVAGTVAVPLTAEGKQKLLKAATEVLEDEKNAQDEALRLDVPPSEGIITPPPGYSVRFVGRRIDMQEGPRQSFTIPDSSLVVRRMMLAIENAVLRDRKPPIGTWTRSAAEEAKIPIPKDSMVTISDRDGQIKTFDVDTGDGWTGATAGKVKREISGFLGGGSKSTVRLQMK